MKKIVYFIQTHDNKDQICRLVHTLKKYAPNSLIIIGHDAVNFRIEKSLFVGLENVEVFNKEYRMRRATFSSCQVLIDAMEWLFDNKVEFDWLINISGQDYPVKNPKHIEEFLSKTTFDAFTRFWSFDSERGQSEKDRLLKRYYSYYIFFPKYLSFLYRCIAALYNRLPKSAKVIQLHFYPGYSFALGVPAKKTPFTKEFMLYRGYAWHHLSSECCKYIAEFVKENPEIIQYFFHVCNSDECFFQTVLCNAKKFNICDDYRRYVDLDGRPDGRPTLITQSDFETITNGQYDFARKFDPKIDSEILDRLDRFIEGQMNA